MFVYCLVDFFNLRLWRAGVDPGYADLRDGVDQVSRASIDALRNAGLQVSEITLRLYGGWHGETAEHRVLLRDLASAVIRDLPRGIRPRLRFELAEAPIWDRSLRLLRTLRQVRLDPYGTIGDTPANCGNVRGCPIPCLKSWLRGRCPDPGCRVKLREVGHAFRQKMVDTLLTADAIAIARDRMADALILASDDSDMYPALFSAATSDVRVLGLRRNGVIDPYYDGLFEMRGITLHTW